MRFTKQLVDCVPFADLLPAGEGGLVLLFVVYKALPESPCPGSARRPGRCPASGSVFAALHAQKRRARRAAREAASMHCENVSYRDPPSCMVLSGNSIAHNRRFVQTAENIGKTEQNRWLTRHRKAGAFLDRAGRNRYGIRKESGRPKVGAQMRRRGNEWQPARNT